MLRTAVASGRQAEAAGILAGSGRATLRDSMSLRCRRLLLPPLLVAGCTSGGTDARSSRDIAATQPVPDAAPPVVAVETLPDGVDSSSVAAPVQAVPSAPPNAVPSGAAVETSWCKEGFADLDDGSCYLVPERVGEPRSLLIYLHGVIAPQGDTQRIVQGIVASHARSRGYVAYMPRGRRGIGPGPTKDWWSWPTTAEHHRRHAAAMVQRWNEAKSSLERLTGAPFARTWLAGSSNGAFFATVLALNGEFEADGFGAMSGGSREGRSVARSRAQRRAPFYVGYGTYDDLKPHPISLGELLREAGWPHRVAVHPTGHGAREVYLEEAVDFWSAP